MITPITSPSLHVATHYSHFAVSGIRMHGPRAYTGQNRCVQNFESTAQQNHTHLANHHQNCRAHVHPWIILPEDNGRRRNLFTHEFPLGSQVGTPRDIYELLFPFTTLVFDEIETGCLISRAQHGAGGIITVGEHWDRVSYVLLSVPLYTNHNFKKSRRERWERWARVRGRAVY